MPIDYQKGLSLPLSVRDAITKVCQEFQPITNNQVTDVATDIAMQALSNEFGTTPEAIVKRIAEELYDRRRRQDDTAKQRLSSVARTNKDIIPLVRKRVI